MTICLWYSIIGITLSFALSVAFEALKIPRTVRDWLLLLGHCFGSAAFAILVTISQQMASFIIVTLAMSLKVPFYFLSQYFIFGEISSGNRLYIEVSGTILLILSSFLPPTFQLVKMYRSENKGYTK